MLQLSPKLTDELLQALLARASTAFNDNHPDAVILTGRKREAQPHSQRKLKQLGGILHQFCAVDRHGANRHVNEVQTTAGSSSRGQVHWRKAESDCVCLS